MRDQSFEVGILGIGRRPAWTVQDINGKADFSPSPEQASYPTPYFNYNDVGGSFGGPVPHLNKTWWPG